MKKITFITIIFFLIVTTDMLAQCAMCRATVENMTDGNISKVSLNAGILYLLVAPYLFIGGLAYFWYKNSSKKNLADRLRIRKVVQKALGK